MRSSKLHLVISTLVLTLTVAAGPMAVLMSSQSALAAADRGGNGRDGGGRDGGNGGGNDGSPAAAVLRQNQRQVVLRNVKDPCGGISQATRTTKKDMGCRLSNF